MATVEPRSTAEIRNIQRRMAQARLEIHHEFGGAVDGVQALTDWRTIVRTHPWLCLAIAAAAGYGVVPRRSAPNAIRSAEGVPPPDLGQRAGSAESSGSAGRGYWEPLASAFALISPIAVRFAQTYASQFLESWLVEHANRKDPSETARPQSPSDGRTLSSARPFT